MHRGLEIDLHLRPGLHDESFFALAIGNLAAFELQRRRAEPLVWQVVRLEGAGTHRFRLIVGHPDRALDLGLGHELRQRLETLANESPEGLHHLLDRARQEGLEPVPLRHVKESVDLWQDDFWNWMG